jgi:3,8-divinyl protochlorophyllide a 8-vinyl-reductase (ferredoxin)
MHTGCSINSNLRCQLFVQLVPYGVAILNQKLSSMTQAPSTPTYPLMQRRLCSNCGACAQPHYEDQVEDLCGFQTDVVTPLEPKLHGRPRDLNSDEAYFGVFQKMYAAKLKNPKEEAQTNGTITTILERLLEQDKVDAVLVTQKNSNNTGTPVLVRSKTELQNCKGSRWDMVPLLDAVPEIQKQGIKRLAVVGVGCQISTLRALEVQLGLEKLYVIGLVCTDNMTAPNWKRFIKATSRTPWSVRKLEFMPDFRVWFWHEDGSIEKVSYFELRMDKLQDCFPDACLSCFDQMNALADLTVGYMAVPLAWQWLLVRNERGQELFDLIAADLDHTEFIDSGDRIDAMKRLLKYLGKPPTVLPRLLARILDNRIQSSGPKGLEFARLVVENKQTRNWYFLKQKYPEKLAKIIPPHTQQILDRYSLK